MEDFYGKLLSFPQWHNKEFANEQLKHHLIECLELLENWDQHLYAELIDLIQISKVSLKQNLENKKIEELYQKRYEKFLSKIKENSKKK